MKTAIATEETTKRVKRIRRGPREIEEREVGERNVKKGLAARMWSDGSKG